MIKEIDDLIIHLSNSIKNTEMYDRKTELTKALAELVSARALLKSY